MTGRGIKDQTMYRLLPFFLLLGAVFAVTASADDAPDVHTLMTPEEFSAAGLGKLSPEELEALNLWLLHYTVKDAPDLARRNPVIRAEIKKSEIAGVKTRIAGEFRGWSGDTLFQLENGQVWRQRLPGRWVTLKNSPEVEIKKNLLGFWVMRVIDGGMSIGVSGPE
jgi:hypothetical protein